MWSRAGALACQLDQTPIKALWCPGSQAAWESQLACVAAYKAEHGECNVPRGWAENLRLGRWVHNQRQYKRKLDRGQPARRHDGGAGGTGDGARLRVRGPEKSARRKVNVCYAREIRDVWETESALAYKHP